MLDPWNDKYNTRCDLQVAISKPEKVVSKYSMCKYSSRCIMCVSLTMSYVLQNVHVYFLPGAQIMERQLDEDIVRYRQLALAVSTKKSYSSQLKSYIVRQSTWKFWPILNLKLNEKVFFSFDYSSIGSQ